MKKLEFAERNRLEAVVKETKNVNERVRICVVLAFDEGYTHEAITDILKISKSSVYDYLNEYEKSEKIHNDPHEGKPCKLNETQESELKAHLAEVTYKNAKCICAYVKETYGIECKKYHRRYLSYHESMDVLSHAFSLQSMVLFFPIDHLSDLLDSAVSYLPP